MADDAAGRAGATGPAGRRRRGKGPDGPATPDTKGPSGRPRRAAPPAPQGPPMPPMPGREASGDRGANDGGSAGHAWPWLVGGLALLALGGAILAAFLLGGAAPEQAAPAPPLVEVASVARADAVSIEQTGFVRPLAEVAVASEVTGRIESVGEGFRRGRFVSEGEVLVRLETRRLEAARGRAEAGVRQAEAALAEARVARDRQAELEEREFASEATLQQAIVGVATAEADLAAARADLVVAEAQFDDATLRAPFDALVTEADADRGDLASAGAMLGTLVAAEAVEIELGLTPADLALLGDAALAVGGRVIVHETGAAALDAAEAREPIAVGEVAAVGPAVRQGTRTVPLLVRVPRPFDPAPGEGRPLRVDELVLLELPLSLARRDAVAVPSRALKGGDLIWEVVMAPPAEAAAGGDAGEHAPAEAGGEPVPDAQDDRVVLRRREVEVLRRADDRAVLGRGAPAPGARVMVSDLPGAADGLAVRVGDGGSGNAPAPAEGG